MYAAGLFNGDAKGAIGPASHRARIPAHVINMTGATCTGSTHGFTTPRAAPALTLIGYALDVGQGVFYRRDTLSGCQATLEQRWYAHATRPSVLVHEIHIINNGQSEVTLSVDSHLTSQSIDLNLTRVSTPNANTNFILLMGINKVAEDRSS